MTSQFNAIIIQCNCDIIVIIIAIISLRTVPKDIIYMTAVVKVGNSSKDHVIIATVCAV